MLSGLGTDFGANLIQNSSDNDTVKVTSANLGGDLIVEKDDAVIKVAESGDGNETTRSLTVENKP